MQRKKTVVIPEGPVRKTVPLVRYAGRGDEGRDVSKPIAYDANGNPLYAPRGITFRIGEERRG